MGFDVERAAWETDKAALTKKAEDAEVALKLVTEELSGLKQHISQMTDAIFAKCNALFKFRNPPGFSYRYIANSPGDSCAKNWTGPRSTGLGQNMVLKLKAVYSLAEQLYAGTLHNIVAVSGGKKPVTLIKTMLD